MSSCIAELYKHLGIFKNTMHFSRVLKTSHVLIELNNALMHVFYFFIVIFFT